MFALLTVWHAVFRRREPRHKYYGHSQAEMVAFNRRLFRRV